MPRKASLEEYDAFADDNPVDGVPVTATPVWSWQDMLIAGKALVNNKDKIGVKTKLSFDRPRGMFRQQRQTILPLDPHRREQVP